MRNQMKLALAALILFASAMPAEAKPGRYSSNRGWAEEEKCFRNEYREEYIPGTSKRPGRVKTYRNKVQVPCRGGRYVPNYAPNPRYEEQYPNVGRHDDNSCIEGSILGGIAGGGAGAALSRKDGRLWAIPLGIVTGSMLGCQVDGG
jgi:hypothetical protein